MPENWKTYKFSELFETASGLSKSRDQFGFGSPFLTFKDVFYNYFIPPVLGDLANTSEKEQNRGSVKRGDIFLTRTSETLHELGMSSVALKDYPNATFNGFCKRLRQKKGSTVKIHPEFIGYFLRSNSFRNEVSQHATMTTRASLNNTSISSLSVTLPPFPEQVEIGEILKALDDKIELNLQMNKTLEEMAMALYKNWFVDFGPFQDEEFVDSELGEIPKGWEVKQLKDFALLIMGQSPKSEFYNDNKEGLPFHQGVKDYGIRFPTDISYSTAGNREAAKGDILFSVRAPVGRLNVAKNKIILGRGLAAIRMPKFNSFLFYALKRMFTTEDSIGSGTVFNSVNKSDLQNLKFLLPPEKELLNFTNLVDPLDQQYLNNSIENHTLTQLRDTLLPKLISGEVRVKDVEKTLTEVL